MSENKEPPGKGEYDASKQHNQYQPYKTLQKKVFKGIII